MRGKRQRNVSRFPDNVPAVARLIRFVDGESSIGRCVAVLEDIEYERLMKKKASLPKTKFGDAIGCKR